MILHDNQKKILDLLKKNGGNFSGMTLRDVGEKTGIGRRAQIVAHHLNQLEKRGYIRRDFSNRSHFEILDNPISQVSYINLYGMAECGPDGFFGEDKVVDKIPLPTRTLGITSPDDFFLVTARGRSMEPQIKEGDLVLARRQDDVDSGSIAVVVHNDIPKIKKVVKNEIAGSFVYNLVSSNSDFKDETIGDESESLRILGVVKSIIRTP